MEIKTTEEIYKENCDNTCCGYHYKPNKKWVAVDGLIRFMKHLKLGERIDNISNEELIDEFLDELKERSGADK